MFCYTCGNPTERRVNNPNYNEDLPTNNDNNYHWVDVCKSGHKCYSNLPLEPLKPGYKYLRTTTADGKYQTLQAPEWLNIPRDTRFNVAMFAVSNIREEYK